MSNEDETYSGWANRETWAVALHINNDQGWQESVREAVRNAVDGAYQDPPVWLGAGGATDPAELDRLWANVAGDAIRENVEDVFDPDVFSLTDSQRDTYTVSRDLWMARDDIGSLWRVDWTELGASFLEDLEDDDA
jgi:hypothetical protein